MIQKLLRLLLYVILFDLFLIFTPLPPYDVTFSVRNYEKISLSGNLAANQHLDNIEYLTTEVDHADFGHAWVSS